MGYAVLLVAVRAPGIGRAAALVGDAAVVLSSLVVLVAPLSTVFVVGQIPSSVVLPTPVVLLTLVLVWCGLVTLHAWWAVRRVRAAARGVTLPVVGTVLVAVMSWVCLVAFLSALAAGLRD